jgi:glyoxylase-like metal-dependent hydrolase (beta-lactamase superfamily II)
MTGHAEAMKGLRRAVTMGGRTVHACSDGMFLMPEAFLGDRRAHAALAGADGQARLPIGCLVVPGEPTVLVDAGMGPVESSILVGGGLLDQLAAIGLRPEDIDVHAFTHLHVDHVGWVATSEGEPVFPNAQLLVSHADWSVFVEQPGDDPRFHLGPRVGAALRALAGRGQLTLMEGEHQVAPGVTALPAPGHTPGHVVYVVQGEGDRLVWLGDVMYVPRQALEPTWRAVSDADPELALSTRQAWWQDLDRRGGLALGSHFAELRPGRVIDGAWSQRTD